VKYDQAGGKNNIDDVKRMCSDKKSQQISYALKSAQKLALVKVKKLLRSDCST